jgi:hypothetical protein
MYGLDKATPFPQKYLMEALRPPDVSPDVNSELHIAAYEGDVERVEG